MVNEAFTGTRSSAKLSVPAGEQVAAAESDSEEYAAKANKVSIATDDDLAKAGALHGVVYRVSVGNDERNILRERAAWLRSLDRKYGNTR